MDIYIPVNVYSMIIIIVNNSNIDINYNFTDDEITGNKCYSICSLCMKLILRSSNITC